MSARGAAALALTVLLTGCAATGLVAGERGSGQSGPSGQPVGKPAHSGATASPGATGSVPVADGTALAQLDLLVVRGRAPMTGYDRDRFGQAWLDADRNGCDTRNDILRRDLREQELDPRTDGCVVLSGVLPDPYTGTDIEFVRAVSYSVDIDHVVALGNAWVSGAWRFDIRERAALANDPLNLLAVDAGANRQKGDGDAATWLPPARRYRCAYVARQVAVKAKYRLSVTPAEKAMAQRVLGECPGQPATPDLTGAPLRVDQNITDPYSD